MACAVNFGSGHVEAGLSLPAVGMKVKAVQTSVPPSEGDMGNAR